MSRRLITLSWLSVFVVAGVLGHLTAQKLHAEPECGPNCICPLLPNSNCPQCYVTVLFSCRTPDSFAACEPSSPPNTCSNDAIYTCSGFVNGRADCSGKDSNVECNGDQFPSCK